jgi:hypothetical protein
MLKKKEILVLAWAVVTMAVISISGCAKDDTVTVGNMITVTKAVSFSKDLVPLFATNCAVTGCHVQGSIAPDLEAATAYNQLTSMDLYNTGSPTSSVIYEHLMGTLTPAMPYNRPTNPQNINGYVLAWITQGALNN